MTDATTDKAREKLTPAQRCFLERAIRSEDGNPWRSVGIRSRGGGAMSRMFERMKSRGWFDAGNCITPEGRRALNSEKTDVE